MYASLYSIYVNTNINTYIETYQKISLYYATLPDSISINQILQN